MLLLHDKLRWNLYKMIYHFSILNLKIDYKYVLINKFDTKLIIWHHILLAKINNDVHKLCLVFSRFSTDNQLSVKYKIFKNIIIIIKNHLLMATNCPQILLELYVGYLPKKYKNEISLTRSFLKISVQNICFKIRAFCFQDEITFGTFSLES